MIPGLTSARGLEHHRAPGLCLLLGDAPQCRVVPACSIPVQPPVPAPAPTPPQSPLSLQLPAWGAGAHSNPDSPALWSVVARETELIHQHAAWPSHEGALSPLLFSCPHKSSTTQTSTRNTLSEALELSGTPLPYFPEMIPQARGDHVIAPTPAEETEKGDFRGVGQIRVVAKICLSAKN